MGFLARREVASGDPGALLRLSAGGGQMPRNIRKARDEQMWTDAARAEVLERRAERIGDVGVMAAFQSGRVRRMTEAIAQYCPEERQEVDAIAQAVAAALVHIVTEAGR